jgi:Nucleotide modification associated domain 1
MNRVEKFKRIQNQGLDLFRQKNKDYGNAFETYGTLGVLMRIQDKLQRYVSITTTSVQLVNDESLRDTLIDLHNYSAMAILLHDEQVKSTDSS